MGRGGLPAYWYPWRQLSRGGTCAHAQAPLARVHEQRTPARVGSAWASAEARPSYFSSAMLSGCEGPRACEYGGQSASGSRPG